MILRSMLITLLLACAACTNVEHGAEKVFSNANEAMQPKNHTILWEQVEEEK